MSEQEYEFQVEIDGKNYGMDTLISVNIKQPLFDKLDVGLACCGCMRLSYYKTAEIEPSRGAKLIPRCRPKNSNDTWQQLGVFYVDLRTGRADKRTLECYDSMMKADAPFIRDGDFVGEWPRSMAQVAQEISKIMGVKIDSRTVLNSNYMLEYPNDAPMRTILGYIAAAHAGNWIITAQDELLLVPLAGSMPPETWYLVTEDGDPITFGGIKILI